MFDTNIVSYIIRGDDITQAKLKRFNLAMVVISAITEAELRFGVAKKGNPQNLVGRVNTLLDRMTIMPWDSTAATQYAALRALNQRRGINLSAVDMLIAAHAAAIDAPLVTNDQAFQKLQGIDVLAW